MTRKRDALEAYRLWREICCEEHALLQAKMRGEKIPEDPRMIQTQAAVAYEEARRLADEAGVKIDGFRTPA